MLLTNNKLFDLLPLNIISCFVGNRYCDPSLNALRSHQRMESKCAASVIKANICLQCLHTHTVYFKMLSNLM